MAAVWLRIRAEMRTGWRAWLALALLIGVGTGAVLTLAAGARRTDTAYDRFLRSSHAYDALVVNYPEDGTAIYDFDEIAGLPQVVDSARAAFEYFTLDAANLVSDDGRIGTEINAFRITDGRRFDPEDPTEAVVGFAAAEEHGVEVGDTFDIVPPECIDAYERRRLDDPDCGELTAEDLDNIGRLLDQVPGSTVRIVGIEAAPGEFPPQFQFNRPAMHLSPALFPLVEDLSNEALMVRLRDGSRDVDAFVDELQRRSGGLEPEVLVQREHAATVERSIRFQALALWILAALSALAVVMILSQLVARLTYLEAAEFPSLRALGMSPRQLVGLGVARAGVIAVAGSLVGVVLSLAASPLLPYGLARTAEPDPGFRIDVAVILLGAAAAVLAFVALSVWPSWRASRTGVPSAAIDRATRAPRIERLLTSSRVSPSTAVGVSMALRPGRGAAAAPLRTTLVGVTLGIAALVATLTFGASLARLLDNPRLYGVAWDTELVNFDDSEEISTDGVDHLVDDERVAAVARGTVNFGTPLRVGTERVDAIVLDSVKGRITPPVLEGRAPTSPDEIAVGARTLRSLDADIGDTVAVRFPGGTTGAAPMRIVGTAVFPTVSEFAQLGQGALVTPGGAEVLDPAEDPDGFGVVVRLAPGADRQSVLGDLDAALDGDVFPVEGGEPTDIVNFGRVERMPLVLGVVLAAIAAGSLAHLLVSAARRRRRELAILKTLGFVRGQVAGVIAIQATTVVVIGLVVGVPVGVALGRWTWTLLADNLGVVSSPQVPLVAVGIVVAGALVLGNVIAFVPARLAARIPPGSVLRSE